MIRTIIVLCSFFHFECAADVFPDTGLVLIGDEHSCGEFSDYRREYANASDTLKKLDVNENLWSFMFNEKRLLFCGRVDRLSFEKIISRMPPNKMHKFDDLFAYAVNLYENDLYEKEDNAICEKNNTCETGNTYIKNAMIGRAIRECPHINYDCLNRNLNASGLKKTVSAELAEFISSWGDNPDIKTLASLGVDSFLGMHPETITFFDYKINIDDIRGGLFLLPANPIMTMASSWRITLRFNNLDRAAATIETAFDYARKNNKIIYMFDYKGLSKIIKGVDGRVRESLISSIVSWGDSYNFKLNAWASSMCVPKERDSVRRYVPWLLAKRELLSDNEKMGFDLYILRKLSECYGENELMPDPDLQHLYLSRVILEDVSRNLTLEQIQRDDTIIHTLAGIILSKFHFLYPSSAASTGCYSKFLSDTHHLNPQGDGIVRLIEDEYNKSLSLTRKTSGACKGAIKYL